MRKILTETDVTEFKDHKDKFFNHLGEGEVNFLKYLHKYYIFNIFSLF